jgi:hypothetical protein
VEEVEEEEEEEALFDAGEAVDAGEASDDACTVLLQALLVMLC